MWSDHRTRCSRETLLQRCDSRHGRVRRDGLESRSTSAILSSERLVLTTPAAAVAGVVSVLRLSGDPGRNWLLKVPTLEVERHVHQPDQRRHFH